jgi:hypothetical protein
MKQALLGLFLFASPLLSHSMLAASMLSVDGYLGGSSACSDSGLATAGCSAQGGLQSDGTGAYTTGTVQLAGSDLVFTVNGSLEAGQSIFAYSNPTAAFSAILPVSDSSGNWIVSGYATSSDSSRYALNIFVNGAAAGYIGSGSSSFLVPHAAGVPLTFSFGDNVSAVFGNDIEGLHFSLTFTDPPADPPASTPEPGSFLLAGTASALIFAYRKRKPLQQVRP